MMGRERGLAGALATWGGAGALGWGGRGLWLRLTL
jgi:hypothetical protein